MKVQFIFIFLTYSFFSFSQIYDNSEKKMVFKCYKTDGYFDVIEISKVSDTIYTGIYTGVEFTNDMSPVYYMSYFIARPLDRNQIFFQIDSVQLIENYNTKIILPKYKIKFETIPDILKTKMQLFFQKESKNYLLTRISSLNLFSKAEVFAFVKL